MREPLSVVVLANGRSRQWRKLSPAPEGDFTALVQVGGRRMYSWVVDAAKKVPQVDDIILVGDWTEHFNVPGCRTVRGGDSLIGSLKNGLDLARHTKVLVIACDIPAVKAESLAKFALECSEYRNLAIGCPIIPVATCYEQFPGLKRTSARLSEGRYTLGNVFYMDKELVLSSLKHIEEAYKLRKKVLKLARKLGLGTLLRFVLAQVIPCCLSKTDLEARVEEILGCRVVGVEVDRADLGTDLDGPDQHKVYEALLNQRLYPT